MLLRRYAWGVLLFNLGVILWGAFVRATGSGAGCGSHWPDCNGEVIPRAESIETLIELTHRATSGVAFLLVFALMVAALRARDKGHPMRAASVATFVLMVLEAGIGAGIVLLEYVADNQSVGRAIWISAHLLNTFLLLGALGLTTHLSDPGVTRRGDAKVSWPVVAALVGTLLVGITGAVTALGDTLFPAGSLTEGIEADFAATAHFLVRLRVYHPVLATLVGLLTCVAALFAAKRDPRAETKRLALAVVVLFCAQLAGGFVNLALLAPVWMQLVHLLMADLLWLAMVGLLAAGIYDSSLSLASSGDSSEPERMRDSTSAKLAAR